MDAAEFRASPALVTEAAKVLNSPIFATMLSALASPRTQPVAPPAVVYETTASYMLGYIKGWEKFREDFMTLGVLLPQQPAPPEITYRNSEQEETDHA